MKVHTPRLRAIDFSELDVNAVAAAVASVSIVLCQFGAKMLKPPRRLNDLTWVWQVWSLRAQISMRVRRVSAKAGVQSNCETERSHLQTSIHLQRINEVKHWLCPLWSIWCFPARQLQYHDRTKKKTKNSAARAFLSRFGNLPTTRLRMVKQN